MKPTRKLIVPERRLILSRGFERRILPRPAPWIWVPRPIIEPRDAVAFDASSTAVTASGLSVALFDQNNLTITSGLTNGALIYMAAFDIETVSAVTAHWDSAGTNQLMTSLGSKAIGTSVGIVFLFGLRNPTAAGVSKNLHITWTTAAQCLLYGLSFSGVEQSSDANAFKNFNSGNDAGAGSNPATVAITSAVNDAVVAAFVCDPGTPFSSTNQTQLFVNTANQVDFAGLRAAGASSVTCNATMTANNNWAAVGVDLVAAAGGAAAVVDKPRRRYSYR